ncbi:MAG: helix-turn-helix domain-containing protein [Planctomycetota bacterium]
MRRVHANVSDRVPACRLERRQMLELLERRAHLFSGRDRLLLTMYLQNGNSVRQLAALSGMHESTIGRRINKLLKRLIENEYILCLRYPDRFTDTELSLARDHFLRGIGHRQLAAKHRCTAYQVRKTLSQIQERLKRLSRQRKERSA